MALSNIRLRQIIREELSLVAAEPRRTNRSIRRSSGLEFLDEQSLGLPAIAAKTVYDAYKNFTGEKSAQGLGTGQKVNYAIARGVGGATPMGAAEIAQQGSSFYSGVLRDTWKNNKMDMLDWGLTAASLAASMSVVGAPIALALDSVSATKNIGQFVASKFKDVGAAIGAVLDLCGIVTAGIAEGAKGFMMWIRQGASLPEKTVMWLAKSFVNIFGGRAVAMMGWVVNPSSRAWLKQSFEQFAKLNADEGIEAVTQKYIKDFVKGKALDAALNPQSVTEKAKAGIAAAKIAVNDNVNKTISVGVAAFVKIANAIIADGFTLLLRDLLKSAIGVVA